jgi:hypothetical protein
MKIQSQNVDGSKEERKNVDQLLNGFRVSFCSNENVFKLGRGSDCKTLCMF